MNLLSDIIHTDNETDWEYSNALEWINFNFDWKQLLQLPAEENLSVG